MNLEQAPTVPAKEEKPQGFIDNIRAKVQGIVEETRLPTREALGYDSTVGVYGGKINYDDQECMVFDMRGFVSKVDRFGDAILRTYDEHTVKEPLELLRRHPKLFFRFLAPGTKRYRGTPEEIAENIERLGLDEEYGLHEWGIEIKDQDIYKAGTVLQDIYRSDLIGDPKLEQIDRFQALGQAAGYVREIHESHGAIGEVLPSDIIWRETEGSSLDKPILNIPDIIYNQEKNTAEVDKKATDLLDFTMSIGLEELRRSGDWNEVQKAVRTIIDHYSDKDIVAMLKSFVLRGRLTMLGDEEAVGLSKAATMLRPLHAMHNKARLGFKKAVTENLRELISAECADYLSAK
ncbi:MAG: hypothetical protein C3F02_02395 [Parcubacteria group bacterium]|nr:MAG: hypothetical protein C3F02_02395 [Parcubacteria group bacterium]